MQSDRTAAWGFSGLLAALVAAAAVRSAGPDVGVWLYAAVLLVAGVVLGIRRHRRLRTAERLAAELEERLAHACGGEPAHGFLHQGWSVARDGGRGRGERLA